MDSSKELDVVDRQILALVQENNLLTSDQLAEKVGASASTIQRRLKRLRSDGIIMRDISVLSPEQLNKRLMVLVEVMLEAENPTTLSQFRRQIAEREEVMQLYYVTGRNDFFMIMTFETMADFDTFTEEYFTHNPIIKRFTTSVVVKRIKYTLKIPI